jgi:hypothetical protein
MKQPRTYGFTTTPEKVSLARVAAEAKKHDKFVLAYLKNTSTGREFTAVLIRKDFLPAASAKLSIVGDKLTKTTWGKAAGKFRYKFFLGADQTKLANKIKNDLRILQNFVEKRIIRVQVEAL